LQLHATDASAATQAARSRETQPPAPPRIPLCPNPQRERWDGAWAGPAAARDVFGADEVYPVRELGRRLPEIAAGAPAVMFDFDRPSGFQHAAARAAVEATCGAPGGRGPRPQALRPLMHRLRWRKSAAELRLMSASALVAGAAIRRCIAVSRPGVHEGALAATFGGCLGGRRVSPNLTCGAPLSQQRRPRDGSNAPPRASP
jgi:Xaa-Pro aminopeptidase